MQYQYNRSLTRLISKTFQLSPVADTTHFHNDAALYQCSNGRYWLSCLVLLDYNYEPGDQVRNTISPTLEIVRESAGQYRCSVQTYSGSGSVIQINLGVIQKVDGGRWLYNTDAADEIIQKYPNVYLSKQRVGTICRSTLKKVSSYVEALFTAKVRRKIVAIRLAEEEHKQVLRQIQGGE